MIGRRKAAGACRLMTAGVACLTVVGCGAGALAEEPLNDSEKQVQKVFEMDFDQHLEADWVLEGEGRAEVVDDRTLVLQQAADSPGIVLWLKESLPDDFRASFTFSTNNNEGLVIVFFCANPVSPDDDLFETVDDRNGDFRALTRGGLASYHVSVHRYFPDGRHNPDGAANLRKNPAFEVVQRHVPDPCVEADRSYDMVVQKRGNRIQTFVDGELIHDYTDDGSIGAPLSGGHLGLRVRGSGEFETHIERFRIDTFVNE